MKKLGAWLGVAEDMVKRKQRATTWMDRTFHDSFLHQSSQIRIAWPSRNSQASRAERKSSSGTAKEVNKEVTQAKSRRVDFICNKGEKVQKKF